MRAQDAPDFPVPGGWTFGVGSMAVSGDSVFGGSSFAEIGPRSHVAGAISTTDPLSTAVLPGFEEMSDHPIIETVVPDGAGGWFVAGQFDRVAGLERGNVAHLLADGTVDLAFAPAVDGRVLELELSPDGSRLYVQGQFERVNGQERDGIAAVRTSDGALTGWIPASLGWMEPSPDGEVVYLAGYLERPGEEPRVLFAVDAVTGDLREPRFDTRPSPGIAFGDPVVSPDGSRLFAKGECIQPCSRPGGPLHVAAFATGDGAALWETSASPGVGDLVVSPDGETLYVGSPRDLWLTHIDGAERGGLAALHTDDGSVTDWAPRAIDESRPHLLAVSPNGSRVYAKARLQGQEEARVHGLSAADGEPDGWYARPSGGTLQAGAASPDGRWVFLGGDFTYVTSLIRRGLAEIGDDGSPRAFEPGDGYGGTTAVAVAPDPSTVYACRQNSHGWQLVAYRAADGHVLWGTDLDAPAHHLAVSPDGTTLYAGGAFTSVGGAARRGLAAVATGNGEPTAWAPDLYRQLVLDLAVARDGSRVYAAGEFEESSASWPDDVDGVVAFDPAGGARLGWDPDVRGRGLALAIAPDGATVYVGGDFDLVGPAARRNLVALRASDAGVTQWDPSPDAEVVSLAIRPDDVSLFASGDFDTVGGEARPRLAELRTSDGRATGFDPPFLIQPQTPRGSVGTIVLSRDGRFLHVAGIHVLRHEGDQRSGPYGYGRFRVAEEPFVPPPPAEETAPASVHPPPLVLRPTPTASSPSLRLLNTVARVGPAGRVRLKLGCTRSDACSGHLVLRPRGGGRFVRRFDVSPSATQQVRVRLGRGARARLARRGTLRALLRLVMAGAPSQTHTLLLRRR